MTDEEQMAVAAEVIARSHRVIPFSNGTEYMHWEARCDHCIKRHHPDLDDGSKIPCDIQRACGEGYITGSIPASIALRMGFADEKNMFYGCAEFIEGDRDPDFWDVDTMTPDMFAE